MLCRPGGMVDATDSKSVGSNTVRVQVPWPVPKGNLLELFEIYIKKEGSLSSSVGRAKN